MLEQLEALEKVVKQLREAVEMMRKDPDSRAIQVAAQCLIDADVVIGTLRRGIIKDCGEKAKKQPAPVIGNPADGDLGLEKWTADWCMICGKLKSLDDEGYCEDCAVEQSEQPNPAPREFKVGDRVMFGEWKEPFTILQVAQDLIFVKGNRTPLGHILEKEVAHLRHVEDSPC